MGLGAHAVQAQQSGNTGITVKLPNPYKSGGTDIKTILNIIINEIILPVGGVIAVMAFVYTGFLYVMAQGNQTKIATAHKALLYTAIGTFLLLGSLVISKVIEQTITSLK